MTTLILTERLSKRYGSSRGVDGLDLEVRAGEVFGFLGPNGAGKTTTIRLLLDLIRPTAGSIQVRMRQPAMAIYPRTDLEFVALVYALLVDDADPSELQARRRETYPLAVVRPRVISSEPTATWYVFRDGRWNPDPPDGSTPK